MEERKAGCRVAAIVLGKRWGGVQARTPGHRPPRPAAHGMGRGGRGQAQTTAVCERWMKRPRSKGQGFTQAARGGEGRWHAGLKGGGWEGPRARAQNARSAGNQSE